MKLKRHFKIADVLEAAFGPLFNRMVYLTCAIYAVYIYYSRFAFYRQEGFSVGAVVEKLFSNTLLAVAMTGGIMIIVTSILFLIIAIRRSRIAEKGQERKLTVQKEFCPIDEMELSTYFKASFKGMGQSINKIPNLVEQIERIRKSSPTDVAWVAYMIYESPHMIKKPSNFKKWLENFFKIVDVEVPADTSKNKYKPTKELQDRFYFLQ